MTDEATPLAPRDYLILLALSAGPRHGWGLIQDIEDLSERQVRMDPANLYRALKRLLRDGWVEEASPNGDDADRRRKHYAITPVGREVAGAEAERLDRLGAFARSVDLLPSSGERR